MYNSLKTADRRAKRTKMWDSRYCRTPMQGTFDVRILAFRLRTFGALCKFSNFYDFQNSTPLSFFHPISTKLYDKYDNHGGIWLFGVLPKTKILTWESMGKPKMWNIFKTAHRRAKWTKMWQSGSYSVYIQGTFDARSLQFGLGSFGALCKISDSTIFETLLQQFSSDIKQTSYKVS